MNQGVLAAMFLAALMIRVDESNEGDETAQAQMSGLLITVIVIPFLVMLWYIIKEFRSELNKDVEAIQRMSSRPPSKSSAENSWETSRLSSNVQLPRFSSNVQEKPGSIEMVSTHALGTWKAPVAAYSAKLSNLDVDAAAEEYPENMGGGDVDFSSDISGGVRFSDNPMSMRMSNNPMAKIRTSSKPMSKQADSTAAEDDIEELKDADGNVYFHNRQSGSTAWTRDEVCVTLLGILLFPR